MAVYPGTYIPTGVGSTERLTHLVDDLLTPRLLSFREIRINNEKSAICTDGETWKTVFGNWLQDAPLVVRKNGMILPDSEITDKDIVHGKFKCGAVDLDATRVPRDEVECSYMFDYFPQPVLEGLFKSAMGTVNTAAFGPPTDYTLENYPVQWEGVLVDLVFAMCMERLLLDYDLWRYRLVFAISPNELYEGGGGGDIAGQLETLKQNAEERAYKTLENEKFKVGNALTPPTMFYYAAIRGRTFAGIHGVPFVGGRFRGWKPNRI